MAVTSAAGAVRSAIDSDRFGISVARADAVGRGEIGPILDWCREERIAVLFARCQGGDLGTVQELEAAGLRLMDAQVRFGAATRSHIPDPRLRPLRPGDRHDVMAVAARSFQGYAGHYHADPRLPAALCDLVYQSWAERCCSGEAAEHVVVAEADGRVVGFSAFAAPSPAEGRLVLGAVLPSARGGRLYSAMAAYGLDWLSRQGVGRMSAITQVPNLAAQRSWVAAGMLPEATSYTFHGWLS